jgi:undecaprenyl-diphosphatase
VIEAGFLEWLAAHRAGWLDAVMLALTHVGRAGAIWVVLAVARGATRRGLRMAAFQVILALVLSWVASEVVLKPAIARPRPFVAHQELLTGGGEHPSSYSFPSGHASTSAAGAAALSAMWPAAAPALWLLAALVVFSRAYLGVHYPSDLLAGLLLGWLIARFVVGGTVWRNARPSNPPLG